jgi:hypothetical protein
VQWVAAVLQHHAGQQMWTEGEQTNGVITPFMSGAASAIALALEHACAVLNGREANGRDPMALQYKGVYRYLSFFLWSEKLVLTSDNLCAEFVVYAGCRSWG